MRATARRTGAPPRIPRTLLHTTLLCLSALGLGGCRDNDTSIVRGDRLWADSSFESALAEYRLAVTQRGDEEALSRLAHAYAMTGKLIEARRTYEELLERSDEYRDQAVFDFLHLARRALARRDTYTAASAMEAALTLRPELQLPAEARAIADFYRERDNLEESLAFYRRALTALPPDSAVPILYDIGRIEGERGRCDAAIDYFRAFEEQVGAESRERTLVSEARWHTGRCAFRLAEEARDEGRVDAALDHLNHVIRLGVPENLLDQALFERGEILFAIGELDDALASYRQVLERNPARAGQLVERARLRIDQIRFGDFRELEGGIHRDSGSSEGRG